MAEQELLNKQGDELSKALGKILQGEVPCWHKVIINSHATEQCLKCESCYPFGEEFLYDKTCLIPDLIPLTPDNAFKWRDWARKHKGVEQLEVAYRTVYDSRSEDLQYVSFLQWLACYKQPEDDLKAAALCVVRSKTTDELMCSKCNKILPPLEASERKCEDGYLCRGCFMRDKE